MEHSKVNKIVLAYSGGLDTSAMLHWLKQQYGCPVVAFVADVGQPEDFDAVRAKAIATGADDVVISDLREEFVREFVFPAVQAHAIYEGEYLLGTSLARPSIAREQVRVAREHQADAVAHGATGKGNDQVRFELTYQALAPQLVTIAPWRSWSFKSRTDLINYCHEQGIPVDSTLEKPYSMDENLMHCSYEGGILEDPWQPPPDDLFLNTTSPEQAPATPEDLVIEFSRGIPVQLDGAAVFGGAPAGGVEYPRRSTWCRPRRPGRESIRRHEVTGSLRDSRSDRAAQGSSGTGVDRPRSGGPAFQGWACSATG